MDPASFSASILALLGAAGGSCKFIYNFILDISDAPADIHSQTVKLRCLHQTISNLIWVYDNPDLPPDLQMDPTLRLHIINFVHEIETIKAKIQSKACALEKGRAHRLWARLKWLSSDRQLHKFYDSSDHWNTIFSQAVSRTKLEISMRILTQTIPSTNPPNVCAEYAIPSDKGLANSFLHHNQTLLGPKLVNNTPSSPIPQRLTTWLATTSEPVNLKVQKWREYWGTSVSAYLWLGPIITRTWSENHQEQYRLLPAKEGYCLSFSFQTKRVVRGRLTAMIFALYRFPSFKLRFNLGVSGYLPIDSAAYLACSRGDWVCLRQLLTEGRVNILDRTASGDTLLHIATRSHKPDIVSALLQASADPNATNDFSQTPLHIAVYTKTPYVIPYHLLTHGASVTHQNLNGQTPLHTFFNPASQQLIQYHCDDLDITLQDYRGMTITHYVSWSKSATSLDILRCVKDSTTYLDDRDEKGRKPLHLALQRGNLELIHYLLGQPNLSLPLTTIGSQSDWHGRTLLHYATESRRTEAVDILLGKGFDIHAADSEGRTVLHHAAAKGNLDAVKKLLKAGAASDLSALDKDARTPLQVAALCEEDDVVGYLESLCEPQEIMVLKEMMLDGHRELKWRVVPSLKWGYFFISSLLLFFIYRFRRRLVLSLGTMDWRLDTLTSLL